MDLWDENRQEWTKAAPAERPPHASRARRLLIATVAAVLLCGALGTGVWLLARDGTTDSGASGSSEGKSGGKPGAAEACEAVDEASVEAWDLDSGEEDTGAGTDSLYSGCTWTVYDEYAEEIAKFSLYYGKETPVEPEPTPISVDGLPEAVSTGNESSCLVVWPTSFGMAVVQAIRTDATSGEDACAMASDFAGTVAGNVPE